MNWVVPPACFIQHISVLFLNLWTCLFDFFLFMHYGTSSQKKAAVICIFWPSISVIFPPTMASDSSNKYRQKNIVGLILNSILATWECRGAAVSESAALKEMTCTQGPTSWHSEIICRSWGGVDHFLYQPACREILVHSDVLTHPRQSLSNPGVCIFSLK